MKKRIIAKTLTNVCTGEIEILNKSDRKVYAKWEVHDPELKMVASLTSNYFLKDQSVDNNEIFGLVKDAILNYRIGRKKLFSSVEFTL